MGEQGQVESLLQASRRGDSEQVLRLIKESIEEGEKLDINCKGKHKSNLGWSPLHLAAYFGHRNVAEVLLSNDADVNVLNGMGDTPLHRAAFTGRTEVVSLLLQYDADVSIINGEGRTPLQMANNEEVKKLIEAAEKSQKLRRNEELLGASRDGDINRVKALLTSTNPPNINCKDLLGNTPLHCAAYRGHKEVAVLLLQNGVDSGIRNNREFLTARQTSAAQNFSCSDFSSLQGIMDGGPTFYDGAREGAIKCNVIDDGKRLKPCEFTSRSLEGKMDGLQAYDLARENKMKQLLDVQPLQAVQKNVTRFEGYIMKKTRFFGWKKHWIVLERGILSAFSKRADAGSGVRRQFFKYLDHAKTLISHEDDFKFKIQYSDHTVHLFSIIPTARQVNRQRWMNALGEHCAYSTHYTSTPHIVLLDELDDDYLPLGSMDDALKNAKAHQQLLDHQVISLVSYFNALQDQQVRQGTATTLKLKISEVVSTSSEVCQALSHCLTILSQQEEVRRLQLEEEAEKRRVLEDALHVLAQEHHALEKSVHMKKQHANNGYIGAESDFEDFDEFFDAPMEFVDSFEQSIVMSTEVHLDGNSSDERAISIDIYDSSSKVYENHINSKQALSLSVAKETEKEETTVQGKPGRSVTICEPGKHRKTLPQGMHSRNEFNIWSVLKHAIGKDLSRIAMPVIFNEPLSFLQRVVEYMDYVDILHKASKTEDPVARLLQVAVFAVASQSPNHNRIGKPFNPLLGETYELIREDMGIQLVGEQVSHHPPVSAMWCHSRLFNIQLSLEPIIKFWGKDIEVKTKGSVTIEFPEFEDAYTFSTIHTGVHNIIVGNMWIELYGVLEITSYRTGHKAIINFKPCGWFGKDLNKIDGYIMDPSKTKVMLLNGDWTKYILTCPPDTPEVFEKEAQPSEEDEINVPEGAELVWQVKPKPPNAKEMYNMTEFAMSLNELHEDERDKIAPTDARLRPDIRELENGNIELAASEKFRLEEKQRGARRERNKSGEEWKTRWFDMRVNKYTGLLDWTYNGSYFKRDWSECPDIF